MWHILTDGAKSKLIKLNYNFKLENVKLVLPFLRDSKQIQRFFAHTLCAGEGKKAYWLYKNCQVDFLSLDEFTGECILTHEKLAENTDMIDVLLENRIISDGIVQRYLPESLLLRALKYGYRFTDRFKAECNDYTRMVQERMVTAVPRSGPITPFDISGILQLMFAYL
jgi:hypothetical protein